MITTRTFLHFLIFLLPLFLLAQDDLQLSKLTPSYSEDFSRYKSHPSICFSDAFLGKDGELWLVTCGAGQQINLPLFQFDGYEFKSLQHQFSKLSTNTNIYGLIEGYKIVGKEYDNKTEKERLFILDLYTNDLQLHELPEEGRVSTMYVSKENQIYFVIKKTGWFYFYEWVSEQFILINKIKTEHQDIVPSNLNVKYFDGKTMWIGASQIETNFLERIDINSGIVQRFNSTDLKIKEERRSTTTLNIKIGKIQVFGESSFLICSIDNRGVQLFKLDPTGIQFFRVDGIPINLRDINIGQDGKGNLIYVFSDKKLKHAAILEGTQGNRFDYSSFFKAMDGFRIRKLISPDFKKQILICNTNGILLHKVKSSEAIQNYLASKSIRAIAELPNQEFLIATQNEERFLLNIKNKSTRPIDLSHCKFKFQKIIPDGDGKLWAVGFNNFIKYDPKTNICEKFPIAVNGINKFDLLDNDKIVFSNRKEIGVYDLSNNSVKIFEVNGEVFKIPGFIHDLRIAENGMLWAATSQGLLRIDLDRGTVEVIGKEKPFTDPRFLCIDEDEQGRLWLGTPRNGIYIYDPATKAIQTVNSKNGLGNNTVVTIVADDEGMRWVGTYNGISLVSPEGKLITNFYEEDGVINRESNRYSRLKSSDGKILIGSIKGLTVIDPQKIKEDLMQSKNLKVYLTQLEYIDTHTGKDTIRKVGLKNLETITLPAARRNLKIHFATSNYFRPSENKYAYMFEGEDSDWTDLGNLPNLNLKNLSAGNHRLLIKGGDGIGNWTKDPLIINIEAKEYFYKTRLFYLLCGLLLGGIVLLWIYNLRSEIKRATKQIRKDKEIIEQQAEQLKELDKAKTQFFTNISHEFRTPLTIISGMIDQIKSKPDVWLDKGAAMIKQNTLNLLNLINQILDLRKLESKKLTLNLVQGDIVNYLRYLIESYQSYAENVGLQLHFLAARPSIVMDYDPEKILRIVSNLLSNATKYNKEGGHIYFHIDEIINKDAKDELVIRVQDTGAGIPEEKLEDIFGRFFQANIPGEKKVMGSGIGLSLTYELVKLMNGEINVNSKVGVGTTFTVNLPITNKSNIVDSFHDSLTPSLENEMMVTMPVANKSVDIPIKERENQVDQPNLLIVEDNPQVQQILVASLEDEYQLQIANNGQEGIDKAIEQIPDIIISDVMMPEKNGFELTATLKTDERTDHIPIILLTAKSDLDSRISGLEKGADAYLAKPFEERELKVRLEKLLELRKKLQARYAQFSSGETAPAVIEDPFLKKVYAYVEKQISNPELDMNKLCRSLGMSRSQVFRKLKALTDKSPTVFIRTIRLQKGKKLLETSDLTVSEVAYDVGFTSLNYFSSAFFEEFGVRPSATRK